MAKKSKPNTKEDKPYREEVETYDKPNLANGFLYIKTKPSSFNRVVSVRRYKVVAEVIEEPIEIIQARIIDLWEKCDNHHEFEPLRNSGLEYGLELDISTFGKKTKKKK